jgi:hypothetical protein
VAPGHANGHRWYATGCKGGAGVATTMLLRSNCITSPLIGWLLCHHRFTISRCVIIRSLGAAAVWGRWVSHLCGRDATGPIQGLRITAALSFFSSTGCFSFRIRGCVQKRTSCEKLHFFMVYQAPAHGAGFVALIGSV